MLRRRSFTSDSAYWSFAVNRLFKKIGARSFTFEADPSGTLLGGSHAFATARDWARFGQLFLQVLFPLTPDGLVLCATKPETIVCSTGFGVKLMLTYIFPSVVVLGSIFCKLQTQISMREFHVCSTSWR